MSTPRVAAFEDLRVGQVVAWERDGFGTVNPITEKRDDGFAMSGGEILWKADCDNGEVVILRDAPAPPVTVRREDYDALVTAVRLVREGPGYEHRIPHAAKALIDNADTGADA